MDMMKTALVLAVLAFSVARFSEADIQRCGDIWTNRGCESNGGERLSERPRSERTEAERLMSKKRFIFNDLDIRRLKANREYDFSFNVVSAQEICLSETSTLEDCQRAVNAADEQLDKRIATALESQKLAHQKTVDERPTQTVVTVVENNQKDIYIVKPHRHRRYDRDTYIERGSFGIRGGVEGDNSRIQAGIESRFPHGHGENRIDRKEAVSQLGSIWKKPGQSIPRHVPTESKRH